MKDVAAHVIAFVLGAAVMAAVFLSLDNSPPIENSIGQKKSGPSQPIAPAGTANPNQRPNAARKNTGPPPQGRRPQ